MHAIFGTDEKRKSGVEPQDIPRIDDRSALDASLHQVSHERQIGRSFVDLALIHGRMCGGQPTIELAEDASGRSGHADRFLSSLGEKAHASIEPGQMGMFALGCSKSPQLSIQMLPGASKRLL